MYRNRGNRSTSVLAAFAALGAAALVAAMFVQSTVHAAEPAKTAATCPGDDSGLVLPSGFCATIFADDIGHARHLVVAGDGVVYVNTWPGVYYGNYTPHDGGFLVALKDND